MESGKSTLQFRQYTVAARVFVLWIGGQYRATGKANLRRVMTGEVGVHTS